MNNGGLKGTTYNTSDRLLTTVKCTLRVCYYFWLEARKINIRFIRLISKRRKER